MARKKILLGMLVIVLMFKVSVAGWGQNLNTGAPTAAALTASDLTLAEFNQIRNATGGFQGWQLNRGNLIMVWTGRSEANFMAVARAVGGILGGSTVFEGDRGLYVHTDFYQIIFFTRRTRGFSAGTVELQIRTW